MHRKVAAALVAALALAIAGCGDSGPTELSRAELVRQVEIACREGLRERARKSRELGSTSQTAFIDSLLAGQRLLAERLDDYTTSGATKADYEAFRQAVERRVDGIERIAAVDRADLQRTIGSMQSELEALTRRISELSRRLGLSDACA